MIIIIKKHSKAISFASDYAYLTLAALYQILDFGLKFTPPAEQPLHKSQCL